MKTRTVSLVIPFYNEKEYIRHTVETSVRILNDMNLDYEIVLVDDGSTDGSERIADNLMEENERIRVIHHKKNLKLGCALRSGFEIVKNDIVIYTDIDMPFELNVLGTILPFMDTVDIVQGYKKTGRRDLKRIVYTKVYNFIVRVLFDINVKDVNCALKVFKRTLLPKLGLRSEGSFINAEFMIKALYQGATLVEFPLQYQIRKYGKSRLGSISVIFKICYEIIKYYPHLISLKSNRLMVHET